MSWGGKRPGAGRKPKAQEAEPKKASRKKSDAALEVTLEPQSNGGALKRSKAVPVEIPERDMLQLLQDVALGRIEATNTQVRAAVAAVQYTHTKRGDGGKKDEAAEKAKKAASKFATVAPPLKLVRGK